MKDAILLHQKIYFTKTPLYTHTNPYNKLDQSYSREEGENKPYAHQGHCDHMAVGQWMYLVNQPAQYTSMDRDNKGTIVA